MRPRTSRAYYSLVETAHKSLQPHARPSMAGVAFWGAIGASLSLTLSILAVVVWPAILLTAILAPRRWRERREIAGLPIGLGLVLLAIGVRAGVTPAICAGNPCSVMDESAAFWLFAGGCLALIGALLAAWPGRRSSSGSWMGGAGSRRR